MAQPTEYVESLSRFGMHLGLERITALLKRLGNPHRKVPSVHIAGTNGKGSTAALVAAVLCRAGYKVGLTTSPHLVSFRERIAVGGRPVRGGVQPGGRLPRPVDGEVWEDLVACVRPEADAVAEGGWGAPTQFEVTTAMAFLHFAEVGAEINVVEVGLGGRFDATNVLIPEVCALTPIGHDHTDRLGKTIEEIAGEKAGILKVDRPAVVAPQPLGAMRVVRKEAVRAGAPLISVADEVEIVCDALDLEGSRFTLRTSEESLSGLEVGLAGGHQVTNAATAYRVLAELERLGWAVGGEALRDGFRAAKWPARLQVLRRDPLVLLDGAHNLEGVQALGGALRALLPEGSEPVFVIGLQGKKPVEQFLRAAHPHPAAVICTRARSGRTSRMEPASLAEAAGRVGIRRVEAVDPAPQAVERALELAGPRGVVCIWGSLYLAGEVLEIWTGDLW